METFFLHVIAAKKLGNSYNQRGEVISLPPGKALMRTFLILMNFVFGWKDRIVMLVYKYNKLLPTNIHKVLSSINTIYDDLEAERSKIMDALSLQARCSSSM